MKENDKSILSRGMAWRRLQPFGPMRAVWLALVSAAIQSVLLTIGAIDTTTGTLHPDAHVGYMATVMLLLFLLLYLFNFRVLRTGLRGWRLVLTGLLGSLLSTGAFTLLTWMLEGVLCGSNYNTLVVTMFVNFSSALISWLVSLLLYNVTEHQTALLENEQLQAENLRIRQRSLERQLSPHFLFNSLNALDALVGTDDERAHHYVQQLARIYRYVLQEHDLVTLREELDFTLSYADMMRTRYGGDALQVDVDVDRSLLNRRLPPISLQMLVENAIKHNVATPRRPLRISIGLKGESVVVSNQKQPKDGSHPDSGLGLSNLSGRYRLLCGSDIDIRDDGSSFTVELPLIN